MTVLTWPIFVLVCAAIFAVLVPAQVLVLLVYVRRRAPLLLRARSITPFLFLAFLFFRCVNSFIAEGYRLATVHHGPNSTISTSIVFSEYFYVWAIFFVGASAIAVQVLQQVVMQNRLEANKQALFQLAGHQSSSTTVASTVVASSDIAAAVRLRRLIRFQRFLASRPLAIIVLIILFSVYLVTCIVCVTLYYTVISTMGETVAERFKLGMFVALICMPAFLFSITGVLLLAVDAVAACIDIVRLRRNAVSWTRIGLWLLSYVIDRPHYLRLETLAVLVYPVIGTMYIAVLLFAPPGPSTILAWVLNFTLLLYPGGGILVLVVLVGDLRRMHERRTAGTGRVKNPVLWQEDEDFGTYMTRVLMSVGDGSKNAQIFLGMMQQSKKECSTENMYSARELLYMIEKLKALAVQTRAQPEIEMSSQELGETVDTPIIATEGKSGGEEPGVAVAAAFEASFESIRRRWLSFLALYIRNDASLEVNLTSELRSAALSLEFDPTQLDSITDMLHMLLVGVLVNLQDTYTRFKRAFEAGTFIEHKDRTYP